MPPLESWKKPPLDQFTVEQFREMLGLMPDEELPEALYLTIGLRMATDRYFLLSELTHNQRCDLLMQAANYPVSKKQSPIYSGSEIKLRSQQLPAIYVCEWAFGKHLVNRYGIWFLVTLDDIEASDESLRDSKLNIDARFGDKNREVVTQAAAQGRLLEKRAQEAAPPSPKK